MAKTKTDCRTPTGIKVATIDTINFLATSLSKKSLENKASREAIKDLQGNEKAMAVLKKLILTDEDIENRRMIQIAVDGIKKSKKKIRLK